MDICSPATVTFTHHFSTFLHLSPHLSPHHPPATLDDDVDLEQLVNEMNSSMESVYSTADTALLLNNGHAHAQHHHHHNHIHAAYPGHGQAHRRHTPPLHPSSPSRERLRHSQPMHIQAVRYTVQPPALISLLYAQHEDNRKPCACRNENVYLRQHSLRQSHFFCLSLLSVC